MKNIARLARAIISLVLFVCSTSVFADTVQQVLYVNGIMTNRDAADQTAQRMKQILDESVIHIHSTGKKAFSVTVIWNPMGWSFSENSCTKGPDDSIFKALYAIEDATTSTHCLYQDNVELAMLKTSEERFAQYIHSGSGGLLHAHDAGVQDPPTDAATIVQQYADPMFGMTNNNMGLVKKGIANTERMDALKGAITSLAGAMYWADPNGGNMVGSDRVIIVAHSQGNLLANLAYAKASYDMRNTPTGSDPWKHVRIINIANTSQFSVSNLNMTNEGDGALFADLRLKNLMAVYDVAANIPFIAAVACADTTNPCDDTWRRVTPRATWTKAEGFLLDTFTFTAPFDTLYPNLADENHLLKETYIGYVDDAGAEHNRSANTYNTRGVAYTMTQHICDPIDPSSCNDVSRTRFRDYFEDLAYTAAASLDAANTVPPLFSDEFNDTTVDTSKWNFGNSGNSVVSGVLNTDTTTNGGYNEFHNIPSLSITHVHYVASRYLQSDNSMHMADILLGLASGKNIKISFSKNTYSSQYCNDSSLSNKVQVQLLPWMSLAHCTNVTSLAASDYYDKWVTTVIDYDTTTGLLSLDVDGDGVIDYSATLPTGYTGSPVVSISHLLANYSGVSQQKYDFVRVYEAAN